PGEFQIQRVAGPRKSHFLNLDGRISSDSDYRYRSAPCCRRIELPTIGFGCAHNMRSMTAKRSRKRVASVREYVASKPKESRASLEAVRRAILKALPNAQEGLAYQMPAYTLNGVGVLYFAGWKSHYSLYPASDKLVEAFAKELAPYER